MGEWPEKLNRHELIMRLAEVSQDIEFRKTTIQSCAIEIDNAKITIDKCQKELKGYEEELVTLSKELSEFQ